MHRVPFFVVLTIFAWSVSTSLAHATTYGEGAYGGRAYSDTVSTVGGGFGGLISWLTGRTPEKEPNTTPTQQTKGYAFSYNLSAGSEGADVVALQTALMNAGFNIPAITSGAAAKGYFGSQTQAAVRAYQAANGIPNTGFVGPLTRTALNGVITPAQPVVCPQGYVCTPVAPQSATPATSTTFSRDLEVGSEGEDVRALQVILNAKGFAIAPAGLPGSAGMETPTFGPATKAALIKFQVSSGISPPTGNFGPKTRAFILQTTN